MAFFTDTCLTDGPHNLSVLSLPSTPVTDVPAQDFTARDILTGFLAPDESASYGRPVGVALGPDGALEVSGRAFLEEQ